MSNCHLTESPWCNEELRPTDQMYTDRSETGTPGVNPKNTSVNKEFDLPVVEWLCCYTLRPRLTSEPFLTCIEATPCAASREDAGVNHGVKRQLFSSAALSSCVSCVDGIQLSAWVLLISIIITMFWNSLSSCAMQDCRLSEFWRVDDVSWLT
ncbi:hypothetical protein BaRGS_00032160 [Batillaria attramentaria]|uniref:Uncharacterized protein n=1 Tax=Batillaria attramentaria TaxID=370345 RepID=A0ABD0JNI7_9CAEN